MLVYKYGRRRDVQVSSIITQFLLYDVLEEYKFDMHVNSNPCTTILRYVCANTTSLVRVKSPLMTLAKYHISWVWIAVEWLK